LLGHSSIVVTADIYTSVLPLAQRRCADATAKLVLDAARRTRQKIKTKGSTQSPRHPTKQVHQPNPARNRDEAAGQRPDPRSTVTDGDGTGAAPP
jgi:hypothetical protein